LLQLLYPFPLAPHHHHHHHHSREKNKKQYHCPNCRKPLALGLAVAELDFLRRAAVLQSLLFCLCASSVAEKFAAMTVVVV
jgi:hypothetical protein